MLTQYTCAMSWNAYIRRVTAGQSQAEIAATTGVSGPTVSRWLSGTQGVNAQVVVQVARAYGQPVLGALVEAGYVTSDEAQERPAPAPSLNTLTDDELLAEIRQRLSQRGATDAPSQEPGTQTGGTPEQSEAAIAADRAARAAAVEEAIGVNPVTDAPVPRSKRRPVSESDDTTTGTKRAGGGGRR